MPSGIYTRTPEMYTSRKGRPSWNTGLVGVQVCSEETKRKMSLSAKGKHFYWRGKELTSEHKEKLRLSTLGSECPKRGTRGEKHWNWQGWLSRQLYPANWTRALKRSVRERDGHLCQMCRGSQAAGRLSVHHIDHNKQNCSPANLISLCKKCHRQAHIKKEQWMGHFQDKMFVIIALK